MTAPEQSHAPEPAALRTARRVVLVLLMVAMVGTLLELLLLEHFEDPWQHVPLWLLALGLAVVGWHARVRSRASLRGLHILMGVFAVAGLVGTFLHYRGNVEFELERDATLSAWALFRESMMGATPALAPGMMIYLGALGIVFGVLAPPRNPEQPV